MEIIIGFMYRKTLSHRPEIKVKGKIHYKYLIYFEICSIIAYIIMIIFKDDISPIYRLTYLSSAFQIAFYSSIIALVRTHECLKLEKDERIPAKNGIYIQPVIIYILFFAMINIFILSMVIFFNIQPIFGFLFSTLSLAVIVFYRQILNNININKV